MFFSFFNEVTEIHFHFLHLKVTLELYRYLTLRKLVILPYPQWHVLGVGSTGYLHRIAIFFFAFLELCKFHVSQVFLLRSLANCKCGNIGIGFLPPPLSKKRKLCLSWEKIQVTTWRMPGLRTSSKSPLALPSQTSCRSFSVWLCI